MKNLLILFTLLTGYLWTDAAVAEGTSNLSWTPPLNQVTNCTEEPIQGLAGYRIWKLVADIDDPTIDNYTVTGLEVGEHTFTATAYNDAGEESVLSGAATKTITELVTTRTDVYDVLRGEAGNYILLRVGSIPLGVACDFTQKVLGLYVVPTDQVTFAGGEPPVVVAECG